MSLIKQNDVESQADERAFEIRQMEANEARANVEARLEAAKAFIEEEERQSDLSRNPQSINSEKGPQFSSSNLKSISIDAYNTPEFKAMLERILKPITIPIEQTNMPADWPSAEKIGNMF